MARRPASNDDDPVYEVAETRPEKVDTTLGDRGGALRPLTSALLKTIDSGGSITVDYNPDTHKRLKNRFLGLAQRITEAELKYSYKKHPITRLPLKVSWWFEKIQTNATPPPEPPEPREPIVGRDVE